MIVVVVRQLDDDKTNIIPNETFLTSFKLKFFGFLKKEPWSQKHFVEQKKILWVSEKKLCPTVLLPGQIMVVDNADCHHSTKEFCQEEAVAIIEEMLTLVGEMKIIYQSSI